MATSKKFGKAIDLSRLLTDRSKLKRRITHVGIELEGGWKEHPTPYMIQRDGSVRDIPGYHPIEPGRVHPTGYGYAGELPSPVLGIHEWPDWVRTYYPHAINQTCGMHVHMSFDNALYYMLSMDARLSATVIEHFKRWAGDVKLGETHPIWPRVLGESRYCQHIYAAEEQILATSKDFDQQRDGHRYTALNYPYGRTGTVECRVLPMMDTADQAITAIQELLDVTNAFLVATAERPKKVTAVLEAESESAPQLRQIFL